mmetsp:Transcript_28843/g.43555  ORF Transcript_28843/g.43555 Transcript_28843/m.43555 type:complete len:142 (+) Transcript_28843:73-498(+)
MTIVSRRGSKQNDVELQSPPINREGDRYQTVVFDKLLTEMNDDNISRRSDDCTIGCGSVSTLESYMLPKGKLMRFVFPKKWKLQQRNQDIASSPIEEIDEYLELSHNEKEWDASVNTCEQRYVTTKEENIEEKLSSWLCCL